jgi:hypothetical protein
MLVRGRDHRCNFGKGPFNDYFIKVWFQLSKWFQTRRFLWEHDMKKKKQEEREKMDNEC